MSTATETPSGPPAQEGPPQTTPHAPAGPPRRTAKSLYAKHAKVYPKSVAGPFRTIKWTALAVQNPCDSAALAFERRLYTPYLQSSLGRRGDRQTGYGLHGPSRLIPMGNSILTESTGR